MHCMKFRQTTLCNTPLELKLFLFLSYHLHCDFNAFSKTLAFQNFVWLCRNQLLESCRPAFTSKILGKIIAI